MIERDRADRVVRDSWRKQLLFLIVCACLKCAKTFDFTRNNQSLIFAKRDPVFCSKPFRPFRDKIYMRTFTQNLARGANRIRKMLYAANAASAKRGSVHDEGVELYLALAIEKAAATRVEGLVIFHDDDSFFDRIERCVTPLKDTPALGERFAHAVQVRFDKRVRNGPRASVDEQNWVIRQEGLRKTGQCSTSE